MGSNKYKRWIERGRRWVRRYLYSELFHHGIKGQKWGVRNGPPYPLDKSKKGGIIEEAIRSGKEKVSSSNIVGVHIDPKTGIETETKATMIVYSKTGTHIYPRKENDK